MNCTKCGATLPDNAKFCNKCGATTEVAAPPPEADQTVVVGQEQSGPSCSTCNASLLPNAKFCAKCGTVVAQADTARVEPSTEVEGARKAPPRPGAGVAGPDAPTARMGSAPSVSPRPETGIPAGPTGVALPPMTGRDWLTDAMGYLQRIFTFDPTVYSEIRKDPQATTFSLLAAALGMFAFGLGGFLWTALEFGGEWEVFWKSALVGTMLGLLFWFAWLIAAVGVLTYVFRQTVRFDEVMRVAGAATATLAMGFFMFIPPIAFGVSLVAVALWVATSIFAFQAAFDLEARQAVGANIIGFAVWALILPLTVTPENPLGPGVFMFDWTNDALVDIFQSVSAFSR